MVNSSCPERISVDLARLSTPEESLGRVPTDRGFGLGQLSVGKIRGLGLDIEPDPLVDNQAHCHIVGNNNRERARRLADLTTVVIPPALLGQREFPSGRSR
jgi:hypothetical protein